MRTIDRIHDLSQLGLSLTEDINHQPAGRNHQQIGELCTMNIDSMERTQFSDDTDHL